MADVTLTVTDVGRATPTNITDNDTTVGATDVYFFANNGRVVLVVTNAAGANTVSIQTPNTVDGLAITDLSWSLTASKAYAGGPFPPQNYNDSLGRVRVTFSAAADVMPLRI